MRRFTLILLSALVCSVCNGQKKHRCMAGIDITSLHRDNGVCLYSGISVGNRWSVGSVTFIRLPDIVSDEATDIHKEDLKIPEFAKVQDKEDLINVGINAQYWVTEVFNGPAISFGMRTCNSLNIEFPLSFGYACRIWKGLKISGFYSLDLLESMKDGRFYGKGICISLGYEF